MSQSSLLTDLIDNYNVESDEDDAPKGRRPPLLSSLQMPKFRMSRRMSRKNVKKSFKKEIDLPEEGRELHEHFRTCPSLTRIREEFRAALDRDEERGMGFGLNCCARPEPSTGRLLLHSIGLNAKLILCGGGSTAAALSRVNQFVMHELLPAHPHAMVEEDDDGRIPFTETIMQWIDARRVVRQWKLDTDRSRERVALVAAKWKSKRHRNSLETVDKKDFRASLLRRSSLGSWVMTKDDEKDALSEIEMIIESSDDAIFCINEKGIIIITNNAAANLFGYDKDFLLDANISIICNPKDADHHDEYLSRYIKTGIRRVRKKRELLAMRSDGTVFPIELGLTEVRLGKGKFIFCGFVKDLTELKRHKRQLSCYFDKQEGGDVNGAPRDSSSRGIPPLVEWSLLILSEVVDNGGKGYSNDTHRRGSRPFLASSDDEDSSSMDSSMTDIRKKSSTLSKNQQSSFRAVPSSEKTQDTIIVEKVAAIPYLLEELLLIEDADARRRIFDMSLVRKILFNIDSIGNGKWLNKMLDSSLSVMKQKQLSCEVQVTGEDDEEKAYRLKLKVAEDECRFLAEGAVFYLERTSDLNIKDDLFVFQMVRHQQKITSNEVFADMVSNSDIQHFQNHRDKLYDTIGNLPGLIRRLCTLDDDLLKRAAATPVIRRMLDNIMFSRFAIISALFDGISHFLLVFSFRLGPAPALFYLSKNDVNFDPHQYLISNAILMSCVVYFGTKAIHMGITKHALSEDLFWSDAFTFWNLLETVPLFLTLFSSIAVDIVLRKRVYFEQDDDSIPFFLRIVVAVTTPLCWLRVLGFLKNWNKQLATFILCSVEIMKDIKWFLLVLLVAMASFAQMWVSLTFDPTQNEAHHYMDGYLKAYTTMLGDLDTDALKIHPMIALLFVFYTFGVTVVLLNILIAIVSDSYQNSFHSSKMMLGKARVMFVSDLTGLQTFHDMWSGGKLGTLRREINLVFGIVAVGFMFMVTGTVSEKLSNQNCGDQFCCRLDTHFIQIEAMLVSLILFIVLFAVKMVKISILNQGPTPETIMSQSKISKWQRTVNWIVEVLFHYLSNSFDSLFEHDVEKMLSGFDSSDATTSNANKKIYKSIDKAKKDLKFEIKGLADELQSALRETESTMEDQMMKMLQTIEETKRLIVEISGQGAKEMQNGHPDRSDVESDDDSIVSLVMEAEM